MNAKLFSCLAAVLAAGSLAAAATTGSSSDLKRRIGQADYYLTEFEKEVARERGGGKQVWRGKRDALDRVRSLKREYPSDPEVEALFQRARRVLIRSQGEVSNVDPAWTQYKRNEEELRRTVWAESEKCWGELVAATGTNLLERAFPVPDVKANLPEDLVGRHVVLDVQYPACQFYGGTGEYVFAGSPSEGYYFVDVGHREWLGPYEAVKRYRDNVNSALGAVKSWKVLGRISDVTIECPDANPKEKGGFHKGWVVTPIALMVPDHVVAFYAPEERSSGVYVAEEKVRAIKEGWYTVKSVPDDVTPDRLMEIFMTAIKEKNFPLYYDCIDLRRRSGFNKVELDPKTNKPVAPGLDTAYWEIVYHWQLHQLRFETQYVHATFSKPRIETIAGFDEKDADNDFFLDADEKAKLKKAGGELVERATVESRAIDPNGKQLGSPHEHRLIRRGGGRWYVEDYAPRF